MIKVILATGIFYPDVGGPAIHVDKIAERLHQSGFEPVVITYGDLAVTENCPFRVIRISRKFKPRRRWFRYLLAVWRESRDAKLIYAFDLSAAGLPAGTVAVLRRCPFILRIGGDPIWERVVEKNKRFLTIEEYYKKSYYRTDNPILYWLIKWVLKRVRVLITYNQFFEDFYNTYFGVPADKIRIIKNPVFKREAASVILPDNPIILFGGRFVSYKNLALVIRAFDAARQKLGTGRLWLVGDGPEKERLLALKEQVISGSHITFQPKVTQDKLFEYIRQSACSIAPALNEFNPNFILESLSFGKPVIISRDNGLSVELPEQFLFNPFDQGELETKLINLFIPKHYAQAVETISRLPMDQTWEKVTDFYLALVKEMLN